MNRTSLHTANRCTVQLNYVFVFILSMELFFVPQNVHVSNDWFIKCHIYVDFTTTDI